MSTPASHPGQAPGSPEPSSPVRPVPPASAVARGRTFAALEERRYRLLWFGGLVSFMAVQMEFVSRGWLAFELTGTNTGLGAVYLGFGVPMLLLSPWGGVAADRLSKRRVLMGCQLALAASSGIVALGITFGFVTYGLLIATAVIQGAGFSFLGPARMAFTAELVGPTRLSNAIVLQQMSMNGTRIFGPSLAGALIGIAVFGIGGVYYLLTTLMLSAVFLTSRLPDGRPPADRSPGSPLSELADGVRYVVRNKRVLAPVLTSFVVVMFAFPYVAFLPTIAEDRFAVGPSGYGFMNGFSAVGAVAASLFIASRADGPRAFAVQVVAGALFATSVVGLGFAPVYGLGLAAILVAGGAASAFQGLNNALALGSADAAYHGRVQSIMMLSFSGFGIAALPLGVLADRVGLADAFSLMGGMSLAAVVVFALVWRRIAAREDAVVK